jgi:hypothetical protein
MDFKNIGAGFYNLIKSELGVENQEIEKRALDRYAVCRECPIFNKELKVCDKDKQGCGCYIPAKIRSESMCPFNLWVE